MTFVKILKDGTIWCESGKSDFLIEGEYCTIRELLKRADGSMSIVQKIIDRNKLVNVPKNQTFWFFGCRHVCEGFDE